jgi:hypothetical protein
MTTKSALAVNDEEFLAQAENHIRGYGKMVVSGIVEIGRKLVEVKERVGWKRYVEFVTERLGWSETQGDNFRHVGELFATPKFGVKPEALTIDASSLYLIAAPSTPADVREQVLEKAATATGISRGEVQNLLEEARWPARKPRPDPAAQRGQPRRDGPDFWSTPACLTTALVRYVIPYLPPAPIWECAAGDGQLVRAIQATGRRVIAATDLYPQDGSEPCDFLADKAPDTARGAIAVTNPPFNYLDEFMAHGLKLLDASQITGLVLLLRHDHLMASTRVPFFNRAVRVVHCCWRSRWIPESDGNPRWSFHWFVWHAGPRQPPIFLDEPEEVTAKAAE